MQAVPGAQGRNPAARPHPGPRHCRRQDDHEGEVLREGRLPAARVRRPRRPEGQDRAPPAGHYQAEAALVGVQFFALKNVDIFEF